MQLTPTYNLKKPEGTDPVDIQDFNDNADIIDAELKKRPLAAGGDVSEMTVKTLDDITTKFPIPEAGEKSKTYLGKIRKFFEDTKNWMTGVCLIGSIVNNCVTDNARLPLSAAQGKALMDLYTVLNTNISARYNADTDWVQLYYRGIWNDWKFVGLHWNGFLYNRGNQYDDLTGGYTAIAKSGTGMQVSFDADRISFSGATSTSMNCTLGAKTLKAVGIVGRLYTRINIKYSITKHNGTGYHLHCIIYDAGENIIEDEQIIIQESIVTNKVISIALPSSIQVHDYNMGIAIGFDNGRVVSGYFSEIWFT